jgi:hypothetical protein
VDWGRGLSGGESAHKHEALSSNPKTIKREQKPKKICSNKDILAEVRKDICTS